ncbi:uncharacterized protein LOC110902217 [Helianthus annuus]|uniref:uncharacterized protein LOC110902217 n=1 Tax=Helianthus annuus TaxID=4232 RepID=UPI000B8F3B1D|nr:uncharacterized protein LOC110902217 [Helianthus annuus]
MGQIFTLHARGYKVLRHIDGTPSPPKKDPTYEAWEELDDVVLQWIYGNVSDELLVRVLKTESTAREAWVRISKLFLNNKGSRAAALEHESSNLKLKAMPSLEAYYQRLRELAVMMDVVESLVPESRLIIQLVRGLPPEYDTTASLINQNLPSWEDAIGMLQLDHQRQMARDTLSDANTNTALTALSSEPIAAATYVPP